MTIPILARVPENARALVGAATVGSVVGLAVAGAYLAGGVAHSNASHDRILRLAGVAASGFSETALNAGAGGDTAVLTLARKHDPLSAFLAEGRDPRDSGLGLRLMQAKRAADAALRPDLAVASTTPSADFLRVSLSTSAPIMISPAAQPFRLRGSLDESHDLDCLTQAVYYEARGEGQSGMQAVAQVVLNRVRHPAFPKSICGVVFQRTEGGCQFSFACDGSTRRAVEPDAWDRARRVASQALSGRVMPLVGNATHFHVIGLATDWGERLLQVAQVGAHVFYRFGGHAGGPGAFKGEAQPSTDAPPAPVAHPSQAANLPPTPPAKAADEVKPAPAGG